MNSAEISPIVITVDCIGDSELINTNIDEGELSASPDDDKLHYKLRALPRDIAIFIIDMGGMSIRLEFNMESITEANLVSFIIAINTNQKKILSFMGHGIDTSYSEISHDNGVVEFLCYGNSHFSIAVPATSVIDCLERLV
jgi:hypothetical protein